MDPLASDESPALIMGTHSWNREMNQSHRGESGVSLMVSGIIRALASSGLARDGDKSEIALVGLLTNIVFTK